MSDKLFKLNIINCIGDILICGLGIAGFSFGSWFFERWWILLFNLLPLVAYCNHTLIIDADIDEAQKEQKGE